MHSAKRFPGILHMGQVLVRFKQSSVKLGTIDFINASKCLPVAQQYAGKCDTGLTRVIVTGRCAVHGFTVLAGASLGHAWPRSLLVKAHMLMLYINSSPEVRAMLQPPGIELPEGCQDGALAALLALKWTVTTLISMEQVIRSSLVVPAMLGAFNIATCLGLPCASIL
jgi:hypothetical protein